MLRATCTRAALWCVAALLLLSGCGRAPSAAAAPAPPPPSEPPAATAPSGRAESPRHAVLAGGCFWCVEAVFEHVKGVTKVVSGYAGGRPETARYRQVARGGTDHAESVRLTYDPRLIRYGKLLQIFMATHHPTQLNRQGPDVGKQYRSALFYANPMQKQRAAGYLEQLKRADVYEAPIQTTLEKLNAFHAAKKYHQDFVRKNPGHAYVRRYVPPKLKKLRKHFPERAKAKVAATLRKLGGK